MVCIIKQRFRIANMTLESRSHILKAYLQFIMQIPLTCLIDAVHIWHNTCLWCVHNNKGLGIWTDLWVKDQSQLFLNMSYCSYSSFIFMNGVHI